MEAMHLVVKGEIAVSVEKCCVKSSKMDNIPEVTMEKVALVRSKCGRKSLSKKEKLGGEGACILLCFYTLTACNFKYCIDYEDLEAPKQLSVLFFKYIFLFVLL